jgi:AcrR family transcriptional regulator
VTTARGRRRREAVLDAAAALFVERGFHGVGVDDLGAAAGISGPGLYRHFASKDELLMAVLDRLWDQLRPVLDGLDAQPPEDALEALVDAHLELVLGQPDALVLLVRELRHLPEDYRARAQRNHRRYVDAWAQALRRREPVLGLEEARSVAVAVHGLLDSAALRATLHRDGADPADERGLLRELADRVLSPGLTGVLAHPDGARRSDRGVVGT